MFYHLSVGNSHILLPTRRFVPSGHEGGFVSLYLSCEPTEEEKERAVDGK